MFLIPVIALAVLWFRMDKKEPQVIITPQTEFVSLQTAFTVQVEDPGTGIRQVQALARQGEREVVIFTKDFDSPPGSWEGNFTLEGTGLPDGPLEIEITTADASRNNWNKGNLSGEVLPVILDTKPPVVSLAYATRYMRQGGAGCVAYTVSESADQTGVQVGENFFPGYEYESGKFVAFYAFPHSLEVSGNTPLLLTEDKAGNTVRTGFPVSVSSGKFTSDKINLSDRFLQLKMPQFQDGVETDLFATFLRVNGQVRMEDNARILEVGRDTVNRPLWEDAFLRLPNAAPRAGFGDHRTYFYQGREVDQAYHLGVDLASLARAPVPAANNGRVVFADNLGIYGQTVIVDHGFGLQTLYSHLSEFNASVGDTVQKGQTIGRTGETGMAFGDHLHFGVLVSGTPVNPIEWWDGQWIVDKIEGCVSGLARE
ncbi:MAG: M23 family metallopeptidase [Desulfovibrionales bacterium]